MSGHGCARAVRNDAGIDRDDSGGVPDGRQLALAGMAAAEAATDVAWRRACDVTIANLAATGTPFTADDVRALVGPPVAASPRAFGARFHAAHSGGVIVPVGFAVSSRPQRHGGILRVWQGVA